MTNHNAKRKYFPKLKGSLVIGSAALVAFLGVWEGGNEYTVYADKLAGGIPTVCKGLTRHVTTTPIVVGEKWSAEKCAEEEMRALEILQTRLADCFSTLPPQSVFDMATSHGWNLGVGATCGSQAMQAWNLGEWELGCKRLAFSDAGRRVWSYVCTGTGPKRVCKFIPGLANRRDAEYRQCVGGLGNG